MPEDYVGLKLNVTGSLSRLATRTSQILGSDDTRTDSSCRYCEVSASDRRRFESTKTLGAAVELPRARAWSHGIR